MVDVPMGGVSMDVSTIAEYYEQSHVDYQLVWQLPVSHGKHFGYHDEDHGTHGSAIENMNRVLAEKVAVGPDDRVLDCGCGIGGSSVWLADERGATVQGVDLVPMQLRKARSLAAKYDVADRTGFAKGDYTNTGFREGSFDVIWSIEAVCHTEDKRDFVGEAARLLDSGGRLVISDGFRAVDEMTPYEREQMDTWLDGLAVPNLASLQEFEAALEAHGFTNVDIEVATEQIMPSSKRLYAASRVTRPFEKVLHWAGLRTDTQVQNRVAARVQHEALTEGLWEYGIVSAELA
jgi:cyclopropane fatty-acyl-phospholipid synthase-like methyltransferase